MKSENKNSGSLTCLEAKKLFNDYLDNFLERTSKEELLQHLEECRHCFDRMEFEQLLKSKVAAIRKSEDAETAKKFDSLLSALLG
jgi:hypothetical protein